MAKKTAKKPQQMTKKVIDEKILRFLLVDEAIKTLQKELKDLKVALEGQYVEDDKVREIISGITCELEKIPINKGAHTYDPAKVKSFTDAIGKTADIIETIEVVDSKKLEELAKTGFLVPENLDVCRLDKWTYKTDFRRKEEATQSEKVSQAAVDNAIDKVLSEVNSIKVPKKARTTKKAAGQ